MVQDPRGVETGSCDGGRVRDILDWIVGETLRIGVLG